jgi:transposase
MYQFFIGIDISKYDFVVAVYGEKSINTFSNSKDGFESFCQKYQSYLQNGLIILETTGGYELPLIRFLQTFSYQIHRANTRKVKHFIRSLGCLAKTDSIDALGLAEYGFERHARLSLFKLNENEHLLKLVQRRGDLVKMLVQEKNRRQAPEQSDLKLSFDAIITALETQIQLIEKEVDEISRCNQDIQQKQKILQEIEGIGKITSIQLLALLPELGTVNRKKIASLAGVAPHPYESGRKIGYRFTKGGRKEVKPVLFIIALTASRSNKKLGHFYQRLVKAGKKKMVAMTALMRKIVVIANAKIAEFFSINISPQHS